MEEVPPQRSSITTNTTSIKSDRQLLLLTSTDGQQPVHHSISAASAATVATATVEPLKSLAIIQQLNDVYRHRINEINQQCGNKIEVCPVILLIC